MGLGGNDVDGVHARVGLATVLDALNSCRTKINLSALGNGAGRRDELAMLLFRMSSSLTALSMMLFDFSSTIKHFH
jgi:hypothetical protein